MFQGHHIDLLYQQASFGLCPFVEPRIEPIMSSESLLPDAAITPQTSTNLADEGPPLGQILSQAWSLLRRFFWIIIITATLCTTAAYFWTKRQPKVYQASARLLFLQSPQNIFGRQIDRVDMLDVGNGYQLESMWNTQKAILRSPDFAERVARRGDFLARPGFVRTTKADGTPYTEEERVAMAARRLLAITGIDRTQGTQVVRMVATTSDPQLAMDAANAYAMAYIDYMREFQSGGLNQMVTWFDSYVGNKRKELNAAQTRLHTFKKDKGILSISYESRQGLTGSNMGTINDQLNQVKARLASEEALLAQIRKMEKQGEDLKTIGQLTSNTGLSSLIAREAQLREKIAQYKGRGYLDNYPDLKAIIAEHEVVKQNLDEEIARIRSGIKNRAETLRRERAHLVGELAALKQEAFELDALGVEYGQLLDNADNLKELFKTVLKRSEELDINSMYESEDIQLLEEARLPRAPISPNMLTSLLIGLIVGLGLGATIIALLFLLDNTVRSEKDITRYTNRPLLGSLPAVDRAVLKGLAEIQGDTLDMITHVAPKSSFAEGIKSLRTNLMFMANDRPPQLMLVTSPGPSEGKTLISTNMAIAMAQSGLKTIIIDSDLRRPRIHKAFHIENGDHGLATLLKRESTLDEAVHHTEVPNLDMISCGPIPPNPSELLHAPSFKDIITQLSERYDRVIFDSPPLGAVSDALVLSHRVDAVILVTKYGQTRRELLRRSIEQLEAVGAPFMGCVLNNIDTSIGAYSYSYYYYRYNYDETPEKPHRREDAA